MRLRVFPRGRAAVLALAVSCGAILLVEAAPGPQGNAAANAPKPDATLRQLMRGVMFPNSNIIFAGQEDVSKIPQSATPDKSTDLVTSMYGGWQAVENASLALAEASDLLLRQGRTCDDGVAVPVNAADWPKLVSGLHDAAMTAYKAAQAKSTDDMLDAAEAVGNSCIACHNVYGSNRPGQQHCVAAPPVTRPAQPTR